MYICYFCITVKCKNPDHSTGVICFKYFYFCWIHSIIKLNIYSKERVDGQLFILLLNTI